MRRLLAALLATSLLLPGIVSAAQPCDRDHVVCGSGPVAMGRLYTNGFETQDTANTELTAGAIDTSVFRTGAAAGKWDSGAGNTAANIITPTISGALGRTYFFRAYVRVSSLPGSDANIMLYAATTANVRVFLRSTGALYLDTTNLGQLGSDSVTNLSIDTWYRIEFSANIGTGSIDTAALRLDGVTVASSTGLAISETAISQVSVGWGTAPGANKIIYADDVALNDDQGASQNTWPGEGRVVLLLPTADSATGTGWNLGTNTAPGGAGHGSLDNTPPTGVADLAVGSDPKQMRNATSNANVNIDMTMTTYSAAGINAVDTINVIDPVTITAAPVTTSSKQGTVGVVSNPAITNIALGATGTSGAFWEGHAAGTYPTGWKVSHGTITYGSSVTVGTAPVMRVTQVTASTRIAMVCFMGMYVDYTPGFTPYVNPYPQYLAQ